MRARRTRDRLCSRCCLRKDICVCTVLPLVRTQAEFLILRHIREANRPSNTGRLVALIMPNSRIVPWGGEDGAGSSFYENELKEPGTWILWPDGPGGERVLKETPKRVAVLDATWHQARRLYTRSEVLRTLPRLVLPAPDRDRERLRKQHRPDGMSTIEAVAAAVAKLEGAEKAEPLEKLYDEVVRRTFTVRGTRRTP